MDGAAPRQAAAGRCLAGGTGAPMGLPPAARGAHDTAGGATSQSLTSGSSGGTTGGSAGGRAGADDATATLHSGPARAATPATGAPADTQGSSAVGERSVRVLCVCAPTGCVTRALPTWSVPCGSAAAGVLVRTHNTQLLAPCRPHECERQQPRQLSRRRCGDRKPARPQCWPGPGRRRSWARGCAGGRPDRDRQPRPAPGVWARVCQQRQERPASPGCA